MNGVLVVGITKNNILATIDITSYNSLKNLYEDLLALKKDVFADDERIIIVYNSLSQKKLIDELLLAIDIPEFFVTFELCDAIGGLDFNFSDNFCIYPWSNVEIRQTGEFAPCCKFQSNILDNQGNPMTVRNSSINEVYQSKFMKDLRNNFRQGNKPLACSDCWITESSGKDISLRQRAAYKFKDIFYTLDYVNDDINNIKSMDLKLGYTCNLSCRICSPIPSSKIATMELNAGRLSKIEFERIRTNTQWCDTDDFWYQFLPIAHNLKELDILGGEPLLVKSHYNFLKKLIELDLAKNIRLDYTSNGTVFADDYLILWKEFKEVKISFSIDDTGDRFEYQRNGAIWQQVVDNIKKYSLLRSSKFITEIFTTVNIQNVYYLPELTDWTRTADVDHISYGLLQHPEYLSIVNLTESARNLVINKLNAYTNPGSMIVSVIKLLENSTPVGNTEFLNQMKVRDRERNQNFAEHHTDIAKAMGYE